MNNLNFTENNQMFTFKIDLNLGKNSKLKTRSFQILLKGSKLVSFSFDWREKSEDIIKAICINEKISSKNSNKYCLVLTSPQVTWPLKGHRQPLKIVDLMKDNCPVQISFRKKKSKEKITLRTHYISREGKSRIQFSFDHNSTIEEIICKIAYNKQINPNNLIAECVLQKKRNKLISDKTSLVDLLKQNLGDNGFKLLIKDKDFQTLEIKSVSEDSESQKDDSIDSISSDDLMDFFNEEANLPSQGEKVLKEKKKQEVKKNVQKKSPTKSKLNNQRLEINVKATSPSSKNEIKQTIPINENKTITKKKSLQLEQKIPIKIDPKIKNDHHHDKTNNYEYKDIMIETNIIEKKLAEKNEKNISTHAKLLNNYQNNLDKKFFIMETIDINGISNNNSKSSTSLSSSSESSDFSAFEKSFNEGKIISPYEKKNIGFIRNINPKKNKKNLLKINEPSDSRFDKLNNYTPKYADLKKKLFPYHSGSDSFDNYSNPGSNESDSTDSQSIKQTIKKNTNDENSNPQNVKDSKKETKTENTNTIKNVTSNSNKPTTEQNSEYEDIQNTKKNGSTNNPNHIDYKYPPKYYFTKTKVDFQEFNRNIMDYVVEMNTKYLKNIGFLMETQNQLDKIQKNIGILEMIKLEMEDIGSFFNKHLMQIKNVVEKQILSFYDFSLPWMIEKFNLPKGTYTYENLVTLEDIITKRQKKSEENLKEALMLIKDLQSLKEFLISKDKGLVDLIKQDLGVYWFSTNNELEMASGRSRALSSFGIKYTCSPIKMGELELKTGVLSKKTLVYLTLSQTFLNYIKLERNKKQNLDEKLKKRELKQSIPLNYLQIPAHTMIDNIEKDQYSFRILNGLKNLEFITNSELEKENWVRMIHLMKSKFHIQKLIRVNAVQPKYPWSYALIFHGDEFEPGLYSIDIRCNNSMWNIKKTFQDFLNFRKELESTFTNTIFPKFRKGLVNKKIRTQSKLTHYEGKNCKDGERGETKDYYDVDVGEEEDKDKNKDHDGKNSLSIEKTNFIEAFLIDILSDLEISQSKQVLSFLKIDYIYNAVIMEDYELMEMIFKFNKKSALDLTTNDDNVLHFAIKNKCNQKIIKLILENSSFLYKVPNKGFITPLLLTIKVGQLNTLRTFAEFDKRIDLNFSLKDLNDITPFLYSAKYSQLEIMKFLVSKEQVNINHQESSSQNSALHYAILHGNIEMVKYLLDVGIDKELKNEQILTPLNMAIRKQKYEIVKLLLEKKCDPTSKNKNSLSSLHFAAQRGNHKILKMLLDLKGININMRDSHDRTAIYYSIEANSLECIKLLAQRNALLNIRDDLQISPIHLSIMKNNDTIIRYLWGQLIVLKNKKILSIMKKKKKYASNRSKKRKKKFSIISINSKKSIIKPTLEGMYLIHTATSIGNLNSIKLILQNNKRHQINLRNTDGNTPLHIAIINSKIPIINYLLLNKAEIMVKNKKGESPLYLTASIRSQQHSVTIADILLRHRALINSRNEETQRTCLHCAIVNKNKKLARFFLEMGADLNMKDTRGNTALHFIAKFKFESLFIYFVQRGADPYCTNKNKKSPIDIINNNKFKKKIKEIRENYLKLQKKPPSSSSSSSSSSNSTTTSSSSSSARCIRKKMSLLNNVQEVFITVYYHPEKVSEKIFHSATGLPFINYKNISQLKTAIIKKFNINTNQKISLLFKDDELNYSTRLDDNTDYNLLLNVTGSVHAYPTVFFEKIFEFSFFEN
ncbi:molting protein mlt-4 [Anaeramoeba flamelloides]|uniref:Molting protein mlt-4 n=1 Tax=Anaeramoeba flamelloides TaxID=1746091 RepID=A0AAV7YSD8_9EUKA|nr:molting protein mlt-4 [Anaeramoeba flamelloides]